MLMVTARALLRGLHGGGVREPSELVARLNRLLCADTPAGMFASLALLRLHPDGRVQQVLAGHEPLRIAGSGGMRTVAGGTGLLLGIDPDARPDAGEDRLAPGEIGVLLTDGVFEAQAAPRWQHLGLAAVDEAILAGRAGGAAGVLDAIMGAIDRHLAGARAVDDITVLVCERVQP